jgi:predicted phosphodiesterase
MKKIVLLFDVHLTAGKPHSSYRLAKKFIRDFRPDETILGGDFMDCEALSHWTKNKRKKMEGKRWNAELAVAARELEFLQLHSKKVTYMYGNHEDWVYQYVDENPEVEGLIEIENRLDLDVKGIEYYQYNELLKRGNLYVTHGMYTPKYHANKHLTALGCNIVYGHTHRPQMDMMNMKMVEPHKAWCMPCLCGHEPEYMKGKPANWMNGFGVVYLSEKSGLFNLYMVDIIEDQFIFEGKTYKL